MCKTQSASGPMQRPWRLTPFLRDRLRKIQSRHDEPRLTKCALSVTRPDLNRRVVMKSQLKVIIGMTGALMALSGFSTVRAEIVTRNIDYQVDGKPMQSVLVYDDSSKKLRPGLVMTPDWLGMNANQ